MFAWGSRKKVIKGTGETVASFPDCARKRSAIDMYNCYKSLTLPNDDKLLCKSTFLDLVHILTVNNNRVVKAVDYVQGMLLNEPCGTLQRIIDDLISDLSMRKDFTRMLEVVRNFLKTQYQVHLNKNDDCGTHSIDFSLNKIYPNGTKVSKVFKGGI